MYESLISLAIKQDKLKKASGYKFRLNHVD
jgi:hypothetical protein